LSHMQYGISVSLFGVWGGRSGAYSFPSQHVHPAEHVPTTHSGLWLHHRVRQAGPVIHLLCAVHDGSHAKGHAAGIGTYQWVRIYGLRRHTEVHLDRVSR